MGVTTSQCRRGMFKQGVMHTQFTEFLESVDELLPIHCSCQELQRRITTAVLIPLRVSSLGTSIEILMKDVEKKKMIWDSGVAEF